MGGPVIKAAQRALDSGILNIVLIWLKKDSEPELGQAFTKALAGRQLSLEARELADMYFFETVIRLHRMGEGAVFTGLKPAEEIDPIILALDRALEQGNAKELVRTLTQTGQENVLKHFKELLELKKFSENDVAAGRKFVEAYVRFTYSIEKIYQAATGVLVEGPTEKYSLPYPFNLFNVDINERGISLIDSGGKDHIPFFIKIMSAFGIPFVVLHDEDRNANNYTTYHNGPNGLNKKLSNLYLQMIQFLKWISILKVYFS